MPDKKTPPVTLTPVWTCGRCGTALRPPAGQLVAAIKAHAEVCVTKKKGASDEDE